MPEQTQSDVTVRLDGDRLHFTNGILELTFDVQTGDWLSLRHLPTEATVCQAGENVKPFCATVGGRTTVTRGRGQIASLVDTQALGPDLRLTGYERMDVGGGSWLVLRAEQVGWQVDHVYELAAGGSTLRREVRITRTGDSEALLRYVDLRVPPVALGPAEQCFLEAPGYVGPAHEPLRSLGLGEWSRTPMAVDGDAPAWRPGLLAVRNGETDLAALCWGFNAATPSVMSLQHSDWGPRVTQRLFFADRMQPGKTVAVGSQFVRVTTEPWPQPLQEWQDFWEQVGITAPDNTPDWAQDARIYEVHLGPKGSRAGVHEPLPTVGDLTAKLPYIADLGFNIVQLMPRFPYPSYWVHDYLDIETQYAPPAELREMVRHAHDLGLKVFLDVVMHGCADQGLDWRQNSPFERNPYLDQHPEWFLRNEDGTIATTYTWAFDHANEGFRQHIVEVFCRYVTDLDVDGFRVDALTWNFMPNWGEGLPYPASANLYGSVELFRRVREATQKIKPEVVFYTETAGPLFYTSYDLSYNYDEQWLYEALLPLVTKRGYGRNYPGPPAQITCREMAHWLYERRLALPRGAIKIHHVDSHDSHEWGGLGQFRREAFGPEAARLLWAFCCFIDGGVMNYIGAEDGSEDWYRTCLSLRSQIPALRSPFCDYFVVEPDDEYVFAPLRRAEGQWAIPVLNFANEPVETTLTVPVELMFPDGDSNCTLREAFTNTTSTVRARELRTLRTDLPSLGVQVWVIEGAE